MPNLKPVIKPISKLTKSQWRRLLERILLKQEGKATLKAALPAEEMGGQALEGVLRSEPEQARVYGRLYQMQDLGGGETVRQPMDYPWVEAVARYIRGKGALSAESRALPEVKVLTPPQGEIPATPEQVQKVGTWPGLSTWERRKLLKGKGSYEKRVYKPIKPVAERIKPAVSAEELEQREAAKKLARKKKQFAPVQKSAEKVAKGKIDLSTTGSDELVKQGLMLDQMWKFIGGGRTVTGRFWNELKKSARGRRKVKDTRDYFYRVGLKWFKDPERTRKAYPREVNSLETIWKEMMEAYGELE